MLGFVVFAIAGYSAMASEIGIPSDSKFSKANPCHQAASPSTSPFPDPNRIPPGHDDVTLVTDKVPLTPENVIKAYRMGIFPWIDRGRTASWYVLEKRGVLKFKDLHLSRSLRRTLRQNRFRITFDEAFEKVIRGCAETNRPHEQGTWISPRFINVYTQLHKMGYAHSAEAWMGDELVGGVYGVLIDGVFSGESMFHLVDDASKVALVELVKHLTSRGLEWMDTQTVTAVPEALGAIHVARPYYNLMLEEAHKMPDRKF
jgi:leucyl/phenylalanyl-tRNA--protein transferase